MAKEKVICPFSQKLCEECALYRGRHYFLCYCKNYRGYLGNKRKRNRQLDSQKGHFEMPQISVKAMDPFMELKEQDKEGE